MVDQSPWCAIKKNSNDKMVKNREIIFFLVGRKKNKSAYTI